MGCPVLLAISSILSSGPINKTLMFFATDKTHSLILLLSKRLNRGSGAFHFSGAKNRHFCPKIYHLAQKLQSSAKFRTNKAYFCEIGRNQLCNVQKQQCLRNNKSNFSAIQNVIWRQKIMMRNLDFSPKNAVLRHSLIGSNMQIVCLAHGILRNEI